MTQTLYAHMTKRNFKKREKQRDLVMSSFLVYESESQNSAASNEKV
jgi:hypothetical protein